MGFDFDEVFDKNKPYQYKEGTRWLYNYLEENIKPKVYLEIGCAYLGVFSIYQHLLPDDGLAIGIDTSRWSLWEDYVSLNGSETVLIQGDSSLPSVVDQVKDALGEKKIDFLFIDEHHDFEYVEADWNNYSPLVRSGDLVAFHDWDPASVAAGITEGQGAAMVTKRLENEGYKFFGVEITSIGTGLTRIP